MRLHEKLRSLRQQKGWSQEEIGYYLNMSGSAYGCIERGETNIPLSRLEDIARIFGVELADLFNMNDKSTFHAGDNNTLTNLLCINSSIDSLKLQHELEKCHLMIEQKDKEIEYLKQQNLDLRKVVELLESQLIQPN